MFPQILIDIVIWLNKQNYTASKASDDGRLDSAIDENNVKEKLKQSQYAKYFNDAKIRHWYDFKVDGHVVQFKSTGHKGADNFSSKQALLYALTDLTIEEVEKLKDDWDTFYVSLSKNRQDNNQNNYYFIVFDKTKKQFFLNSLKDLTEITTNGSNLPFQINWNKNRVPLQKTGSDVYRQLITEGHKVSRSKNINAHRNECLI